MAQPSPLASMSRSNTSAGCVFPEVARQPASRLPRWSARHEGALTRMRVPEQPVGDAASFARLGGSGGRGASTGRERAGAAALSRRSPRSPKVATLRSTQAFASAPSIANASSTACAASARDKPSPRQSQTRPAAGFSA